MKTSDKVSRVRNEVEIHSRLKHPSVLELYNYFEDKNYVYLVLEICHNGALDRYLKTSKLKEFEGEVVVLLFNFSPFVTLCVLEMVKGLLSWPSINLSY